MDPVKYSLVVPVYNNEDGLPELLLALQEIAAALPDKMQVILVVDGGDDQCHAWLERQLPAMPFESVLLLHSRNFGAFPAIRSGLMEAKGQYISIMAADLQEPPSLIINLFNALSVDDCDVVVACREQRGDPAISKVFSAFFWWLYRAFIIPDIPVGGVGTIACTQAFKDELLKLNEKGSSMVGLIYWLGFRRKEIAYVRQHRRAGKSTWTFAKKVNYFFDSIFSFSDLPIKVLISIGLVGLLMSIVYGAGLLAGRLLGIAPDVPGYAATMMTILFFGAINVIGIGIIGAYVWRAFSNTQNRPTSIIMKRRSFKK